MGEESFNRAYEAISKNIAQKLSVDTTEGPVLVIAGPGTGKTQILSVRVGQILRNNPTILPGNILCLTFTESGAANMRDRLTRFIGQSAYEVNISTYHTFGSDLIRRYPEYFTETRLQNPVDSLGRHQIIESIVDGLSYINPLKQTRYHLNDLISTISEVKRALLSSSDIRRIARENLKYIDAVNEDLVEIFTGFKSMPRRFDDACVYFTKTLQVLQSHAPAQPAHPRLGTLASVVVQQLSQSIDDAQTTGKTSELTKWKNKWLVKNSDNCFILNYRLETRRVESLASVLEKYEEALSSRGLYDFDDMILRSIEVLTKNPDLKYTLQEQYQYILLDEFQDTNAAQLRIVQLLTDNPVNEGRPNVLAVGDDDQAIYAFQGAQYSNMLDFYNMYKNVLVVNLTENYRSHENILTTASNVASQISERVFNQISEGTKDLRPAKTDFPESATLGRHEFLSDIAQYDWIASQIKELIDQGTKPSEIAVLAPRHSQLEPLVPFINSRDIPLRYEKRENILEAPVVRQVLTMANLAKALSDNNTARANALWPEVLSYEFWHLPTSVIWNLSWQISDSDDKQANWTKVMLEDGSKFRIPALIFLSIANQVETETFETILDYIIGNATIDTNEEDFPKVSSPLRDYYLSDEIQQKNPFLFYETLSHLTVLRAKVRDHQAAQDRALLLSDVLDLVAMYGAADERMLNTSPYNQDADAVQLMTVFKAKGLEFEHVFLPSSQDEVWGGSGGSGSNKLTLPPNLLPIRHGAATDDERLRIFYVAVTRAKFGLHITSYKLNYSGKLTKRLKYLNEQEHEDGSIKALVLSDNAQTVQEHEHVAPELHILELDWRRRHVHDGLSKLEMRALFQDRLDKYQLSPTHLSTFTDLIYGGPADFYFHTLLRFPRAPTTDGQFGNAIHETLEWMQHRITEHGKKPKDENVLKYFKTRMLSKKLAPIQLELEIERGEIALNAYLSQRSHIFKPTDKAEVNFRNEGVILGDTLMAGKIDRMEIDKANKTISVVDYKTGKSYSRWISDPKLHKYKRQLYCYKILIEHSRTFSNYEVRSGRLEFIEPDKDNNIRTLEIKFNNEELEETKTLLLALWKHVKDLQFPDTSGYPSTLAGIKSFEQDLISGKI